MNVSKRLTELRESFGLSKTQLAKISGVSQSFISYVEAGQRQPTLDIIERLCTAFGITVIQFLEEEDNSPPDLQQLIETTKKLPPEERKALNEYLKIRLSISAANVAALQPRNDDMPTYELNQAAIDGKPSEITDEERRMFEEKKRLFKELNGEKK